MKNNKLETITRYANQYIVFTQTKFSRIRDAGKTDITKNKTFNGLPYSAGVSYANRLNLEEIW